MELSVKDVADGVVCIELNGRLDTLGVDRVETRFTAASVASHKHALVDLSAVSFISSMGVRMLVAAARAMQQGGHRLALFGAPGLVLETLENVALDRLMPLSGSQDEALQAVQA